LSEFTNPDNFKGQLPKNLLVNIANFILSIIIGLFLIPYFIGTLGVSAYGLIPLATSITGYVTILTDSLNGAVSRFLTIDLHQGNCGKANKTFNTALFCLSGIIVLLIPLIILLSFYAPIFFNVPIGQESEVVLLFLGVFSAFLLRSWSGSFTVLLYAYNRLDLLNLLNIMSVLIQLSLIVVLFNQFSPQLRYIGLAYLISSILFLLCAILLSKRVYPHLYISVHDIDRSRFQDLTQMGWWAVVDQIGSLLFLQIDLIVVNLLFGSIATGEYAMVFTWAVLIRGIAGTLAGVLSPMILTYYAKDKVNEIILITKSAVKGMGLFIALPIGLACGFAPQLLTLWVGPQFTYLAPLMWVLILPLVINISVIPLFTINVAFNKVRIPGIVTFFMGIGNVILAFSLPVLLGWGYFGVAVAGAIVLTLKNTFFTPWYATKIMGISSNTFTRSMITGVLASLVLSVVAIISGKIFMFTSLIMIVIAGTVISGAYLIAIWCFGLNQFERDLITRYIPRNS